MLDKFILAGLVASASAHIKMTSPAPFDNQRLSNGPLDASGSNFPCKNADYSVRPVTENVYAQGSTQTLEFIGSAVHGGGSCQVSLTTDLEPTKNSVWKVIKSIEGGCPAKDQTGNLEGGSATGKVPYTYDFQISEQLGAGNYTIAWTWFNKVGNREMYMNCAPVSVTGSGGSPNYLDSLPDMFVANVGNGCGTKEGTDVQFPDPGQDLDQFGLKTKSALGAPTGNCKPGGNRPTHINTSGASQPTSGSSQPTSAPQPTSAASKPTSAPQPTTGTASRPQPTNTNTPGGPRPTTGTPTRPRPSCANPPGGSNSTSVPRPTRPAGNSIVPVSQSQTKAPAHSPTRITEAGPAPTPGTDGAFAPGTSCAKDGMWNCVGGTSFQRCANSKWSETLKVTEGMACAPGQGEDIKMSAVKTNPKPDIRRRRARRHSF
ncbi:glycoside hydrolase [Metarhizium guizhouense ARSEF 977]|uniref:Glycoside hydrolase n=1 Tax=Metarhizium guizhouense (strain ARSEF 977) TaxID=1276136 RepID=A0A0B4I536_METGA|nr:glycoside hydrolase [Metarhizium guizhouense ARSEF 977]